MLKNRKTFFVFAAILLTSPFCFALHGANSTAPRKLSTVKVLADFENEASLNLWSGPLSFSRKFPAHGRGCAALDSSVGKTLFLESEKLPGDWSGYEYLKFDIYNPSKQLHFGNIQIDDALSTEQQAEFRGQSYRGKKIFLNRGWNHFEFLLKKAMVEEGDRHLALEKIRKFRLSFGRLNHPIYLDNFRLVSGTESAETASHADPTDCRVVIDDRYVYPALVGPSEMIKTSPEISQLRMQAEAAVKTLEEKVKIAELQGYQTLYQRIPLITARVGLGIRSKLVWFQNEEEQRKILEYVIASCSQTAQGLEKMLTAQGREIIEEPEDEVNPPPFYVPLYPSFKTLKPVDGFYRDQTGKPVLVFSMLAVDKGPLMDYFAPFNHRLESYTVGGGSRYDVESSPVYRAFHKYPDTHRIGWDGWCGHLIKDRWSMGGKKEDVVICLESSHTRQAVLKYMKMRYNRWKTNSNLLYNIMAYELQYICYCEKSQQMFRQWLQTKYKNIAALNIIWETEYNSFDYVTAPPVKNGRPVPPVNRAAWYDWALFNTRRFTDYLKWNKTEIRKLDPDIPLCAGGTSSMLSSGNSTTGIDEEMIINEVDDVIINESGSSEIFSDLFTSLSEKKKVMVDPEMSRGVHRILLQFLHGKSDITKWWWARTPSREFPHLIQTSIPHSPDIPLQEVAEVLRIGLDVRRLGSEIAEFSMVKPEIAILYSKTSILQVPPRLIGAGRTPYIKAVYSLWEGSRSLGCRIGFVTEKQILAGKLASLKLLLVPAVKYARPGVTAAVFDYVEKGGTVVVIPESFLFDQYARRDDQVKKLGITIKNVILPPLRGEGERSQNYDQSFSQKIIYGEVRRKITTLNRDIFSGTPSPVTFFSDGLAQTIDPGNNRVLARFDDGSAAIVQVKQGLGVLYYLAAPLRTTDYHALLSPLAEKLGLKRPVVGVDSSGKLVVGAEVRSVERQSDFLVYAVNLTSEPLAFSLKSKASLGAVTDLRSLRKVPGGQIRLAPYQESLFRVEK